MMPYWLVPQGAEFQAVRQGLSLVARTLPAAEIPQRMPQLIPIPLGSRPLDRWLPQLQAPPGSIVLLLGVAGSLTDQYPVPAAIVCASIQTLDQRYACDAQVLADLRLQLPQTPVGHAFCSDRIVTQVAEKRDLGSRYGCDLVEMEGAIVAQALGEKGLRWGMVRVISDDLRRDIPDLSQALRPDGGINPLALAATFLQQPLGAAHFIQGSLQALSHLKTIAHQLGEAQANFERV